MSDAKVIDVFWFSSVDSYGIVVIENPQGERKAYLGSADGGSEQADIKRIINNGSKVYSCWLKNIIKLLDGGHEGQCTSK